MAKSAGTEMGLAHSLLVQIAGNRVWRPTGAISRVGLTRKKIWSGGIFFFGRGQVGVLGCVWRWVKRGNFGDFQNPMDIFLVLYHTQKGA